MSEFTFLKGGGEIVRQARLFDWTQTSLGSPGTWPVSLQTTVGILLHSSFPMFLLWGNELVCFYNDACHQSLGQHTNTPVVFARPGKEVWPAMWTFIEPVAEQVMATGETVWIENQPIPVYRNGQTENVHWDFSYSPAFDDDGQVNGVFVTCTRTQAMVKQQLEASENRFRQAVDQAPVAILLLKGDNLVIAMANPAMLAMMDRSVDCIGLPLEAVMPELTGQSLLTLCQQVYRTGEPYFGGNQQIQIYRNGQLTTAYFNVSYTPFYEDNQLTGVLQLVNEVTDQVMAYQALEESERKFRTIIEQAPVATCLFVGADMRIELANDLMISFFGKGPSIVGKPIREVLYEQKDEIAIILLNQVFTTGEPYFATAAPADLVIDGIPGTYYFDFSLKPLVNAAGDVYAIMEMAVDVTQQVIAQEALKASEARYRKLAVELEEQVEQRTQQLQASIQDLQRSNENLQQFAYIASHDLQEPLRKIQSFGDLLRNQYADQLAEGVDHLQRMQLAAGRMSTLIRDLLAYSRISTQQDRTEMVSLASILDTALTDLDLLIYETGAVITTDSLPSVLGDPVQLCQLFQNLLSNALKFRKPNTAPVIDVRLHRIASADLPPLAKPTRQVAAYHRLDVADQGIGFDDKYADRIFQVFQRLHTKQDFAGTGIGLAICQKIAANHGGAITVTSQPGQGATFSVYFPVINS